MVDMNVTLSSQCIVNANLYARVPQRPVGYAVSGAGSSVQLHWRGPPTAAQSIPVLLAIGEALLELVPDI